MQTFLPYSDYDQVAQVLDNKRLNKQILESYQILKVLSGQSPTGGWRNHPAVLMWKGHESELYKYAHRMMNEASLRGITITKNYSNLKELEKKCKGMWGKGCLHGLWIMISLCVYLLLIRLIYSTKTLCIIPVFNQQYLVLTTHHVVKDASIFG